MAKAYITDFSAGELSPKMAGRFDIDAYARGCRTLRNMTIMSAGGITRRPGTKYITTCKSASIVSRLTSFQHSATKGFLVELSSGSLRLFNADTEHTAFTTSPYLTADVFEVMATQAQNVMYLTHEDHRPRKLTYFASTDGFTLTTPTLTGTLFSAVGSRPAACAFHERRLIFGFPGDNPMTLWGSKSVDTTGATQYEDFTIGVAAADAYTYEIAAEKGDRGRWLLSHRDLMVGCFGTEYNVTGLDAGITPTNIYIRRQSEMGSALVPPQLMRSTVLYVQRGAKRVLEQFYSRELDAYSVGDLTAMAEHISGTGIVDTALQTNPQVILWAVTSNGHLIGLSYNHDRSVVGWHDHVTDGSFESVAVVQGDSEDTVYVAVKRTVDGATVRYIEKFSVFDYSDVHADAFFVDSGIVWDGGDAETITVITKSATCEITFAATTAYSNDDKVRISDSDMTEVNEKVYTLKNKATNTFDLYTEDGTTQIDSSGFTAAGTSGTGTKVIKAVPGLSHLEGESVVALTDGGEQSAITVASGVATLTDWANKVNIGLAFTSTVEPMGPMVAPGAKVRQFRMHAYFHKSYGCKWGPSTSDLEEVAFDTSPVVGQAPALVSGVITNPFPGDRETGALKMTIRQEQPNPMTILYIVGDAVVGDR